jgi:hypothetical protein
MKEVENATTIDPNDAPKDERRKWQRLRLNNQPGQTGRWRDETVHIPEDRKNTLDAVASQLELTSHQRSVAELMLEDLSDDHFRGNPISLIAFVVCGLAGSEDGRQYHPRSLLRSEDNQYANQAEKLGIEYSQLSSAWYRIEGELYD